MGPEWSAVLSSSTLKRLFHVLTVALLSLLLPLSFLLLARLSFVNLSSSLPSSSSSSQQPPQIPSLLSLFFHPGNPSPVHAVVPLISVSVLLHCLTGWTLFHAEPPSTVATGGRPRLSLPWALLCTMQVSVGLGVEGSIAAGIGNFPHLDGSWSATSRALFFLGLDETMAHWCWTVVRPVVDDTVYGAAARVDGGIRRWPEKVAMAAAYCGLWWWRLRDEVESMVTIPLVKKELQMGLGMADFVGWWLYYLTATIGMVRVVRGMLWIASHLVSRRVRHKFDASHIDRDMV